MNTIILDKKNNCFTFVRYIAAINVFLLHISHLTDVQDWLDIIIRSIHGIPMFFTLSGFLIWLSLERTNSFIPFFKKRIFRLYPELWGGVLVNAFTIIILYHKHLEWKTFLLFQFTQSTIFQQWTPNSLRGYGCGTPNGVLGSISLLLQSYFALWFLYKILHGKKIWSWIIVFCFSLIVAALFPLLENYLPSLIYKLLDMSIINTFRMFWLGAFVAEFFDKFMPFLKRFWFIFLIAYILMKYTGIPDIQVNHPIIRTIFIGLATLGFGYAIPNIKVKYDITYGMFIYHMIVINAFIALNFTNTLIAVIAAFVLTIIFATISYISLGTLSQRLKTKPSSS